MLPQLLPASDLVEQRISGHAGDGVLHVVLRPREEHDTSGVRAGSRALHHRAARRRGCAWAAPGGRSLAPTAVWSRAGADPPAARQRLFDRFRAAADPEGLFSPMTR